MAADASHPATTPDESFNSVRDVVYSCNDGRRSALSHSRIGTRSLTSRTSRGSSRIDHRCTWDAVSRKSPVEPKRRSDSSRSRRRTSYHRYACERERTCHEFIHPSLHNFNKTFNFFHFFSSKLQRSKMEFVGLD